ncbi:hypothetical protein CIHG_00780 [Coccidioides immitis H538.4]|uniref:Uncharacterized protein n=2 Tax=Coccidioides immitis TaxID=5501 RepID=A0A0J8U7J3_COCIT|nr:hypothetical protein CIRG_03198 [Coccidioides immitis RMSCC 2394]KMU82998.1 hypothetical protein CIHG_00780 [Coccidioides immitis H538.4]
MPFIAWRRIENRTRQQRESDLSQQNISYPDSGPGWPSDALGSPPWVAGSKPLGFRFAPSEKAHHRPISINDLTCSKRSTRAHRRIRAERRELNAPTVGSGASMGCTQVSLPRTRK